MPNSECLRIADQLRRSFEVQAWHGPALREILSGVNAEQANARPLPSGHSIWELVLHIEIWTRAGLESAGGAPLPKLYGTGKDWPSPTDVSSAAWTSGTETMFQAGANLARAIEGFGDERLTEIVPGRKYDFYHLFHGIVQHSLYHGGQISMLKNAVTSGKTAWAPQAY